MLGGLFRRPGPPPAPPPPPPVPADPEGHLYAVGDIHGRADLLMRLLETILEDAPAWQSPPEIVFLGDYVDRADGVRDVLDFLIEVRDWDEIRPVFLMGNHERMLLRFLGDPVRGGTWIGHGGIETLASYGIRADEHVTEEDELRALRDALAAALGPEHRAFLEAARPWHLSGNLFCTHAGADPARPPEEQSERALLWGHRDFALQAREDGLWVVHGHEVVDLPRIEGQRVAVDTGAWFSDRLSAARIHGGEIGFLATESGEIVL
ncbi:MAG: metallophosphoesterase [Pseudomonadota bacterium]